MEFPGSLIFDDNLSFHEKCRQVFEYQYSENAVYRRFCDQLDTTPDTLSSGASPPKIPIEAFKESRLYAAAEKNPDLIFRSSGTGTMQRSTHYVADKGIYRKSILEGWKRHYPAESFVVWAYTPGYNENPESSLIHMLQMLIEESARHLSKFLPLQKPLPSGGIEKIAKNGEQLILFGAAFGLVEMAEKYPVKLPENSIIIETGGMKTYRKEMARSEMHELLARRFSLPKGRIHSEYGMAEMLSQAYAGADGWFTTPHWLQVDIHEPQNPLKTVAEGEEGLIGITDLANIYSCPFFLTGDRGLKRSDGAFQVLGRYNQRNLRGCNFLMEEELAADE